MDIHFFETPFEDQPNFKRYLEGSKAPDAVPLTASLVASAATPVCDVARELLRALEFKASEEGAEMDDDTVVAVALFSGPDQQSRLYRAFVLARRQVESAPMLRLVSAAG